MKKTYLFISILIVSLSSHAQESFLFDNPSFEGPPKSDLPPSGWSNCGSKSTVDTQPSFWGVETKPSEGKTYISMVCREDGSSEMASQYLYHSLEANIAYSFSVDLAYSFGWSGDPHYPALFRVWGGDAQCESRELLWQSSQAIDHPEWRRYTIHLNPQQRHQRLIFETYFAKNTFYWGRILVDNLSPLYFADLLPERMSFCYGDSLVINPALEGDSYQWQDGYSGKEYVVRNAGIYTVEIMKDGQIFKDITNVYIEECADRFYIPNVITPNEDNKNDQFEFKGIDTMNWHLVIVNQWGQKIYEDFDYKQNWKAEGTPSGIYYYVLEKSGYKPLRGWLQVIHQ
ncbi:gliding motility-associated C-terminal domain-containing protein [Xanthocytophaga agilis]|uniref:Gliding motility-associated C-terminal domain-containing protein n=1 Tax=Xanthocytophaga agilis TaxID=3048010 RepID=A0AAE3RA45_9BACT|nr:gliding motility-associated C-terminal domain-containing protein [Xanthocytophaga agilis]MDJ1503572.1 gliding motility-associated C-terminal domain-containing protein [Xanthocytophaga agilis]